MLLRNEQLLLLKAIRLSEGDFKFPVRYLIIMNNNYKLESIDKLKIFDSMSIHFNNIFYDQCLRVIQILEIEF